MINPCLKISKKDQTLLNYNLIAAADVGILDGNFSRLHSESNLPVLQILTAKLPNYQRLWQPKNIKIKTDAYYIRCYSPSFDESWALLCNSAIQTYSTLLAHTLINQNEYFRGNYNQLKKITNAVLNPAYFKVISKNLVNKACEIDVDFASHKFTNKDSINWIKVYSAFSDSEVYLPAQLWFEHFPVAAFQEKRFIKMTKSGIGIAETQEQALELALISALKNHAFMQHWYFSKSAVEIVIDDLWVKSKVSALLENINKITTIFHLYQDSHSNLFHIGCYLVNQTNKFPAINFGLGSGTQLQTAVINAVEAALNTYIHNCYHFLEQKKQQTNQNHQKTSATLNPNLIWYANPKNFNRNYQRIRNRANQKINYSTLLNQTNNQQQSLTKLILANLQAKNYDLLIMDITAPEIKNYYSVVKVLVPQLLPLMFPSVPFDQHPNFRQQFCHNEIHPLGLDFSD